MMIGIQQMPPSALRLFVQPSDLALARTMIRGSSAQVRPFILTQADHEFTLTITDWGCYHLTERAVGRFSLLIPCY